VRVIALIVRAGLVVVALGALAALLDDGATPPLLAAGEQSAQPTSSKPTTRQPPKGTFTFSAVGDIVMGSTPNLPPDGGASFFSEVAPDLQADVSLGNLQGTLSTGGSSRCGAGNSQCFAFHTPPSYARWLKDAGFTVLNLANNHADDFGPSAERETVRALNRYKLLHTGRPAEIAIQRVNGIRVAILGFAPYPWAQSLTNIAAAKRLVRRASTLADVVIVMIHAGAEGVSQQHVTPVTEYFLGENRGNALAFSHAVIDAGADLVVGSGPHVLRGVEWYRNRLIAYSLGNFAGYKVFGLGGRLSVSAILHVTIRGNGSIDAAHLVATRLAGVGTPALDPSGTAYREVRQLSAQDFGSGGATVSSAGTIAHA
jgi:poly-gamma-glutamate capsule biosynthesis protein CapA/YwtB (metallophosphatase superfamily)